VHFLIRTITGRGQGEALETEYQGDQLTLGSAENNTVQLAGLNGELRFRPRQDGSARFRAIGLKPGVEGRPRRKGIVDIGSQLSVPGYTLAVIPPPQGFEFALQITAEGIGYADGMDLAGRAWSVRRSSWIGALLVLALGLLLPALVLLWPDRAEWLRHSALPDDSLWSSGPLIGAHATAGIAAECQACHRTPFVMVEDSACLQCHRTIHEHVDIGVYGAAGFSSVRCASCHREHNEPARLVRRDNPLCVDCHSQPQRWEKGDDSMAAVTAFTAEAHPQFSLDLLVPVGPGAAHGWEIQQGRQGDPGLAERSNLKFNHTQHLDREKVQLKSTGEALSCGSCHTLQDDGEHFKPIAMDDNCRSCHKLSFDTLEPDLELPHGDLRAAIVAMEAHFIREFTDPELRSERAGKKPRRIPGKRDAAASCEGSGLECGRAEALKEAQFQFAETGCITCHEVINTGLQDIQDRWFVEPIRITGDWFRGSHFNHASHLNQASTDTADICLSCHKATTSKVATDILIPDQANCLACHDQQRGEASVNCVSCHAYHLPEGSAAVLARGVSLPLPHPPSTVIRESKP